jgi:UMF1 family MFS transporter
MKSAGEFMALAALVGLAQGGVQSLSRSYFATLLPAGKSGEYFGFFNSFGRFSAVLGPALLGLAARLFGSRNSILALLPPLFFGIFLLLKLKSQSGAAEAA